MLDERSRTLSAEGQRRDGLVDALMVAAPDGVPFIVDALRPAPQRVVPLLRRRVGDASAGAARQLRGGRCAGTPGRAAGQGMVEGIATAPPGESRNLANALATAGSAAIPPLRARGAAASDPAVRARYASILLSLGEPGPAREALATPPRPGDPAGVHPRLRALARRPLRPARTASPRPRPGVPRRAGEGRGPDRPGGAVRGRARGWVGAGRALPRRSRWRHALGRPLGPAALGARAASGRRRHGSGAGPGVVRQRRG